MKLKYLLVTVIVLIAGYLLATPYLTVNQMREAARARDANALAAHIEFPSVRRSFKAQFKAVIDNKVFPGAADSTFARIGAGVATALVDRMIDFMVTPEGVQQLMSGAKVYEDPDGEGQQADSAKRSEPFADISRHYESLDRFVATVKTEDGEDIDFVLQRRGLDWKLAEIRLPLQNAD